MPFVSEKYLASLELYIIVSVAEFLCTHAIFYD